MLEFKLDRKFIFVEDVELVLNIVFWFCIGGMFLGVIFREIYEVIVVVMNRIGGKFNLGEGGEVRINYFYYFCFCDYEIILCWIW